MDVVRAFVRENVGAEVDTVSVLVPWLPGQCRGVWCANLRLIAVCDRCSTNRVSLWRVVRATLPGRLTCALE